MLNRSIASGLRVDKEPAIGAVGYHGSDPRYSTGHIVVVVGVDNDTMRTVEGNNSDRIDDWQYPIGRIRNRPETQACQRGVGWDFIHVEDAGGAPTHSLENVAASLIGSGIERAPSMLAIAVPLSTLALAYMATRWLE